MKKRLPVLLALALTAAALAGCAKTGGQGVADARTAAPETTASDTASPGTKEKTESTGEAEKAASEESEKKNPDTDNNGPLRIGSLKGPTSMGLVHLMEQAEKGEAQGAYDFQMVTAADELLGSILSGELDIALLPANMSSILFNKTDHNINVLNINTLGVLYVVSADESIKTAADLKGKTICLTGKGTTPDYALQYILKGSGLSAEDVTLEYKSEAAEVAAILKEKPESVGLLPQPFVTVAMTQNDSLKMVLDLTKEWEAAAGENGGSLVTGVTVCSSGLLKSRAEELSVFLSEQKESALFANENVSEAAELVAKFGILEKAPVAQKAIPYSSITYIDGEEMKAKLSGYLQALYDMDPKSVGGKLPTEDFYYLP